MKRHVIIILTPQGFFPGFSTTISCPLICSFTYHGFSYLWSTAVQNYEIGTSRNKQFLCFELCAILTGWWNLLAFLMGCESSLCLVHPRCRCPSPVSHSGAFLGIRSTVQDPGARLPVTLVLLNHGPKAQEQWCWQFRYAKEKQKYPCI